MWLWCGQRSERSFYQLWIKYKLDGIQQTVLTLENRFFPELLYELIIQCHIQQTRAFSIGSDDQHIYLKQTAVKTKQRQGGTKLNSDEFHAGGLCAVVRGCLKSELC